MKTQSDGTTREGLVRVIRRWDLVAVVLNFIVGAGIFGLPAAVFALVGVYSLLAFLFCAFLVTLILLCHAEVSSRYDQTGGPYIYAREAFGPVVGFEVGWLMWIARLTAFAANCNLLVAYFGFFVPSAESGMARAATITLVVTALTAINIVGIRDATILTNGLTLAKMLPLTLFVVVGVFFVDTGNYTLEAPPALGDFSLSVLLLVYAFSGFEMAAIPSGEARNPRRDLPWAMLTSIAVVAVLYFLIQWVSIGTLPELAGSTRPLTDAGGRFMGPVGAAIISAGAIVSILGNLNVGLMVAPRLPFAMAKRKELPGILARIHPRFHTPYLAVYLTGLIVLLLTLTGTFVYAATVSVIARLLAYAVTCAALPVLRRRQDSPTAEFLAPLGVAVSLVSLLLVAWLLTQTTGVQARDAGIAAVSGLLIYFAWRRRRPGEAGDASN